MVIATTENCGVGLFPTTRTEINFWRRKPGTQQWFMGLRMRRRIGNERCRRKVPWCSACDEVEEWEKRGGAHQAESERDAEGKTFKRRVSDISTDAKPQIRMWMEELMKLVK